MIKQWVFEAFDYETLDMSFEGILCSKFTSKHSDYNIIVFSCYLPPENSVWGRDSDAFFAHILGDIYSNCDCDAIYLCGDFNARIGTSRDISDFDVIPERSVLDNFVNQHGHSFVEFLNEAKFCTLNGRFDTNDDNYTSVSSKGNAVVDYICVPHDTFEQCLYFKVITSRSLVEDADLFGLLNERSKIPDHSILLTEFKIHDTTCQSPPSSSATCSTKRYKLNAIPVDFLSSNISKLALQSVIQRIESARETQNEVDDIYSTLCKLLVAEMDANIPTFDTSKRTKKRFKNTKPFWNDELAGLWHSMRDRERAFLRFKGSSNIKSQLRREFQTAQNIFDRTLRKYERKYKRSMCNDIENMSTENPREFWNKIITLGPRKSTNIPMEVYNENGEVLTNEKCVLNRWKTDFENIYNNESVDDFDSAFQREALSHKRLLEDRMLDPLYDSNAELNRNISFEELEKVLLKAKNGKSVGIDQIPYEILKLDSVKSVLLSLFQLVFDTSLIPSLWRKAVIFPLLKDPSSDKRVPLNYRGISLLSCLSKLYSAFVNNRLTTYLENNDMLSDEQNGFRAERSCEDHVFTLSSIIRNKPSVFATFIDLKKAFDFVDRDLLLYKLLLLNIDGKIYNSIKSIYSKTTASIRVNGTLTDWIDCRSGERQGDNCSPTLFSIFIDDLVRNSLFIPLPVI